MEKQEIILITHGDFDKRFLNDLSENVAVEFHHPVRIQESQIDLTDFYDSGRRQYNGYQLLKEMENFNSNCCCKKIGLFRVDLFIPILTYIFGQAILGGSSGIASLYRLKNEQYGIPPDQNVLLQRFEKVIIHELGHTFGLVHCQVPNCVMRPGTYVEDIDQKRHHLCSKCRNIFQNM